MKKESRAQSTKERKKFPGLYYRDRFSQLPCHDYTKQIKSIFVKEYLNSKFYLKFTISNLLAIHETVPWLDPECADGI